MPESEQDLSDHFPLVAKLKWASAGDGDDEEEHGGDEDPAGDVAARLDAIERKVVELMEEISRLREEVGDDGR